MWIKESGPLKSNTVVVFSHRFLLDHSQWDPVVEKLNKKYRCLQYDLRRHGHNVNLEEKGHYAGMAEDLKAILKSTTMGPPEYVVLIGEELGGWINNALRYYQKAGDKRNRFVVDALISINSGFHFWHPSERAQLEVIIGQWRKFGFNQEVANLLSGYQFGKPANDPFVAPWLEKWKKMDGEHIYEFYRYLSDMNDGFYHPHSSSGRVLRPFECPSLLIRGKNDGSLTNQHIEDYKNAQSEKNLGFNILGTGRCSHSYPRKVVEIEGGRALSLTNPSVLATEIEDFLSTIRLDLTEKDTPRNWYKK
jgi:pimeloyl-ACP methyl ester carboxylesterase